MSLVSPLPPIDTGAVFRNIYWAASASTLFVSTDHGDVSKTGGLAGKVFAYKGGTWSTASIVSWPSGVTLTGLNGFYDYSASATSHAVMVGADIGGYYEIGINPSTFSVSTASTSPITLGQPGNTTTLTAGADYVSTALASAHVLGFFEDAAASPTRIFALSQNGLWLNEPSSTGQRTWTLQ